MKKYLNTISLLTVLVAALDQVAKSLVVATLRSGESHPLIGDWLSIRLLHNPGAAFSTGTDFTWIFTTVSLLFVAYVIWDSPRLLSTHYTWAWGLFGGGALGNLLDRLFRAPEFYLGHVVDFISVGSFPVFNFADAAINVGVFLLIVGALREHRVHRARRHAISSGEV